MRLKEESDRGRQLNVKALCVFQTAVFHIFTRIRLLVKEVLSISGK